MMTYAMSTASVYGPGMHPTPLSLESDSWDAWSPSEIHHHLGGVQARWCVIGGWALDLFRGEQTREHGDLEIAIPFFDFDAIWHHLAAYEFFVRGREGAWRVEDARGAFFDYPETYVRDPQSKDWKVDIIRNVYDGDDWVCQLERTIRRPYVEAIGHTTDGIPYLRPELVLLYKGLRTQPHDPADFHATAPLLDPVSRRWLAGQLRRLNGDDHPWLPTLTEEPATRP